MEWDRVRLSAGRPKRKFPVVQGKGNVEKKITFYFRGDIERGTANRPWSRPGYKWIAGYSESNPDGSATFPWNTRAECQELARAQGAVAVFKRS